MYRRCFSILIAITLATLLVSSPALAVSKTAKTDHTGFFIGFGLGYGNQGIDFENDDWKLDREDGGAGVVFIGGALKRNLLLGYDGHAWTREDDNVTRTISTSTICLTYYATPKFFLKGGVGLANAKVEIEMNRGRYSYSESGFGMTAGMGMEFRLKKHFALVPSTQWSYQSFDEFKANTFSITFGIGWYW